MNARDSEEEDGKSEVKKRKIQRACDMCRRKKSDGIQTPGSPCSSCVILRIECTYVEAAKKRNPPKAYITALENRVENLERLIRWLTPGDHEDPNRYTTSASLDRETWFLNKFKPELEKTLSPNGLDDGYRYYGRSSNAMLTQLALDLKHENTLNPRMTGLQSQPGSQHHGGEWEDFWEDSHSLQEYSFPEDDLLDELVNLYFQRINLYFPLLHRPTFDRLIADNLHRWDDSFAGVLLLVCANAARYSNDPRVCLSDSDSWLSAGWKWFSQVEVVRKTIYAPARLYDLQFYCLYCEYLLGTSTPQSCWTVVEIGLTMALDIGAHVKRTGRLTVEGELMKRAFWVLIVMDIYTASILGRTTAIQVEGYDVDLLVECDDEFWDHPHPDLAFKQPQGIPSKVTAFNNLVKVLRILSQALRVIYCIDRERLPSFLTAPRVITDLDAALKNWADEVPTYLRWDPAREDATFFSQSVMLYSIYYYTQILVHRPFVSISKLGTTSFPPWVICTTAARSAIHIMDLEEQRGGNLKPYLTVPAFTAGVILLLDIWSCTAPGRLGSTDLEGEMRDVYRCMRILEGIESRWHIAGRSRDVLCELAAVGELPLPKRSPSTQQKQDRDSDSSRTFVDHSDSPNLGASAVKQQELSSLPVYIGLGTAGGSWSRAGSDRPTGIPSHEIDSYSSLHGRSLFTHLASGTPLLGRLLDNW
ncbi:hypothetical protein L218DRAFT_991408 [Marasmius fiardii PR-910]|nr:hypothetical protein L218DRAFT_991408 [Marasmius fiardii PR-910]